ncbi:PAS domain S-box-containing protein/diguanylate cyclase (GGDEF) domain-containing protein [Maledivibacter halophilus]|uniref:PAS domain S-box-containing protein/diguanylate cyclase (GGDEF) domain-containing protein n=1 Tax=Maledivibacter halophilus TaxID=36842 RepID=A0A1T5IER1_9FIRM|nr:PAS domain S-box-containing protein/diguanylate cyclase (GGDEF) domain-containing protein [Maledivibacter halophilus]
MEWLIPSIISSLYGTSVLILIYTYLYKKQKNTYLLIWSLSWILYFLRFFFMLLFSLGYKLKIFVIGYYVFTLFSGLLLIIGLFIFLKQKIPSIYLRASGIINIWIILGVIYDFPQLLLTIPLFAFMGLIYLRVGIVFLKISNNHDYYNFIGYIFIIWGLHKLDYPFLIKANWFTHWGYIISAVLSLAAAIGILIVYFGEIENDLKNSKKKLHNILSSIPDLLFILNKDNIFLDYQVKDDNNLYTPSTNFIGKKINEVLPEDTAKIINHYMQEIINTHEIQVFEYQLSNTNNIEYYEARLILNKDDQILAIIRDISDKKVIEESLKESEAKYRSMMEALEDLVFISSCDFTIEYANPAMIHRFGKDIIGKNPLEIIIGNKVIFNENTNNSTQCISNEITIYDGTTFHLLTSPLFHANGNISNIHILRDISHLKKVETELRNTLENLKYLSYHDKLTGLYNRAFFEEELRRLNTFDNLPLSIIIIDVNGLKLTNDAFGHKEGDKLLKTLANVLKNSCKENKSIARIGGDEFTILLPKTNKIEATKLCLKIKKNCREYSIEPVNLSIAIGADTKIKIHENIDEILKKAENIMYRNKLNEGKSIRNSIILSIQKMLRERSNETEEHGKRMKELALHLGKQLKLTDREMDELSLIAILHDIGKIGIPDYILTKNGPLTEEEWEIMKKHCEIGYHIVKSSPELGFIADTILSHHERWDGNGYPRGIKGEKIPKLSRIISIIDAYDVMTHNRSYRKAISYIEAIEELRKCSGTQFDPELVNVFIKSISETL